jgi:hypothetical protein
MRPVSPNYAVPWRALWPRRPASLLLVAVLRMYQLTLSPLVGRQCRFMPSCSNYALEAVVQHGVWRGVYLAGRRLLRCHPWGECGTDPVPLKQETKR